MCDESNFAILHESLLKKNQSRSFISGTTSARIVISLRLLHGDLNSVRKAEPILLKNSAITRKMGFSDVIMPGDVRNDLYLTLVRAEFERGTKTAQRNVEVKVLVVDSQGEIIPDCFVCGSGEPPRRDYLSYVYYHNNTPRWNETVKIVIPTEINKCRGSHIRMEFRHCSRKDRTEKKPFVMCFMKLVTEDGTTVCDGPHELFMYKGDDPKKMQNPKFYSRLPSCSADPNYGIMGNQHLKRSEKETIIIETLLCSTKLTQNADLLGVLRWKDNLEKIDENLEKLMNLEGEEIVKYLQDIMDALFNMFALNNGNRIPQAQLVFKALVYIFNFLWDPKFEHFRPVMDAYISGHFSAVLVYKDLLHCLKEILEAVTAAITAPSLQEPFRRTFKVLEYLSKCIVQSRMLYQKAFTSNDDAQFAASVQEVFDNMADVLSLESDVIVKTQSVLLESLPKMLIQFSRIHPKPILSRALVQLINHMPRVMDTCTLLYGVKLKCLREVVNSEFFSCSESKNILLPLCMGQIKRHLLHKQEMSLCATMLGDILTSLHKDSKADSHTHGNVQTVISSLLEVVVITTLDMAGERTKCKGLLVTCCCTMLRLMDDTHYRLLLGSFKDKRLLREFIGRLLELFSILVKNSAFPKDWMVMRMVMNNSILEAVKYLSQTMCDKFLRGSDFDGPLWENYFNLAVCFLTQPCLQLESFSQEKRQRFLHRYGDMRVQMGYEILSMWQSLGDHKLYFVPGMVGPFLEVTLVPETELRKATLPIFFDMMQCEQKELGNFKKVETELLDHLDILISCQKGDDEYKQLFNTVLLEKVQTELSWHEAGSNFIHSITHLLERLLDYRSVLEGEENTEKRMTCTMNLLNFYKHEVDRQEMYIRYLYKLKDLHQQSANCTEAGFTLLLHGELLNWTDQLLPEENNLPMEHSWVRKERLYKQVIDLFDKGQAWEYGIPLCKELAEQYERKIQYRNLSQILQKQAEFYQNILNVLRPEPSYFRVGFFGQSFPLFLRNREFVYRGNALEKLTVFHSRLHSEFSGARDLPTTSSPNEDILQGNTQYIQICAVKPLPNIEKEFLEPDVTENVRGFYKVNNVDTFQLDRPFHDGKKDDRNEFRTLHIERTTMRIDSKLPGILRWFEIVQRQTVLLYPIQVATDTMEQKNSELRALVKKYKDKQQLDLRPLTMSLNGVIDAAVSGGFAKYQEAFFTPEFSEKPGNCEPVSRLKGLFLEQLQILAEALEIHGRLVSSDLRDLHKRMVDLYTRMRKGIRDSGSPNMDPIDVRFSSQSGDTKDKRASQISSSSSVSSTYTSSTPPGSNRSSGVYSEVGDNVSTTPAERGSTGSLSESGHGKKAGADSKAPGEPNLNRGSNPSLNSAVSSVSLDSGIGPSVGHVGKSLSQLRAAKTQSTMVTSTASPPALPPRKGSLTGTELLTPRRSVLPRPLDPGTPTTTENPHRNWSNLGAAGAPPGSPRSTHAPPTPLKPGNTTAACTTGQEPPPIPPKRSVSNPVGFTSGPGSSSHPSGSQSGGTTPSSNSSPSVTNHAPPPIPSRKPPLN